LRLTREGVSFEEFQARFGTSMQDVFEKELNELLMIGLIEQTDSPLPEGRVPDRVEGLGVRVKLTNRGRLLGNQVFMRFV